MKRKLPFILFSVFALSIVGCGETTGNNNDDDEFDQNTENFKESETSQESNGAGEIPIGDFDVALHFKHDAFKYSVYEVWTWDWSELPSGRAESWTTTDDFGAVYYLNTENYKNPYYLLEQICLIKRFYMNTVRQYS